MAKQERFSTLHERLMGLIEEPENEQGCWLWREGRRMARNYPALNIRAGSAGHKMVRAHRAMLVLYELFDAGEGTSLFWELYETYSIAGFDADHLCDGANSSRCINPDHLQWLTKEEHERKTRECLQGVYRRYRAAPAANERCGCDEEEKEAAYG